MAAPTVTALELAWAELRRRDPALTAARAGGRYEPGLGLVSLDYFGRTALADPAAESFRWGDDGRALDWPEAVAALHYLANADGSRPGGELLPYRDLWGARAQSGPFIARPAADLAAKFAREPGAVALAARSLGAKIVEKHGDLRLEIAVLPHVPVVVLLYAADEDLEAEAVFLFDAVIRNYLPTEDVAWLGGRLAELLAG